MHTTHVSANNGMAVRIPICLPIRQTRPFICIHSYPSINPSLSYVEEGLTLHPFLTWVLWNVPLQRSTILSDFAAAARYDMNLWGSDESWAAFPFVSFFLFLAILCPTIDHSSAWTNGLAISSLPSFGLMSTRSVPRATIRPSGRVVVVPSSSVVGEGVGVSGI